MQKSVTTRHSLSGAIPDSSIPNGGQSWKLWHVKHLVKPILWNNQMAIQYNLQSLSFLANTRYSQKWTTIGLQDLIEAVGVESNPDQFEEIFASIFELAKAVGGEEFDLNDLFTVVCEDGDGELIPSAVFGGSVVADESGNLLLTFGNARSEAAVNRYPVTQDGKILHCGNISGDLILTEKEDDKKKKYYILSWKAELVTEDDVFVFDLSVPIRKDGENTILINDKIFLKEICKNKLNEYVKILTSGGGGDVREFGKFTRSAEGASPLKAKELGAGTYSVVGIQSIVKGDDFFAILQLADGSHVWANSKTKTKLAANLGEHPLPAELKIWEAGNSTPDDQKFSSMIRPIAGQAPTAKGEKLAAILAKAGLSLGAAAVREAIAAKPADKPELVSKTLGLEENNQEDIPF